MLSSVCAGSAASSPNLNSSPTFNHEVPVFFSNIIMVSLGGFASGETSAKADLYRPISTGPSGMKGGLKCSTRSIPSFSAISPMRSACFTPAKLVIIRAVESNGMTSGRRRNSLIAYRNRRSPTEGTSTYPSAPVADVSSRNSAKSKNLHISGDCGTEMGVSTRRFPCSTTPTS